MPGTSPPRVQLLISGKFVALLLLSLSQLAGGYYWYNRQQEAQEHLRQTQERFKAPPYFVNRGSTIIRSCSRCLDIGKLKPQTDWKMGPAKEIPATEQRWFLAVEDPPMPVTVSGVLMLPVHPAFEDNPSFGFDQNRMMLVLYQNLERKPWIVQSSPPPSAQPPIPPATSPTFPPDEPGPAMPPPPEPDPVSSNAESTLTSTLPPPPMAASPPKVDFLGGHSWCVSLPRNANWFDTGIPIVVEQVVKIAINTQGSSSGDMGRWSALLGSGPTDRMLNASGVGPQQIQVTETAPFTEGVGWVGSLRLRITAGASGSTVLDIRTEYLYRPREVHLFGNDRPGAWEAHQQQHREVRMRAERIISQMPVK